MTPNLFAGLPSAALADEQFATILQRPGLRIERIVSTGQASPPDFWYDQDEGEWVVLLQGEAKLRFADEADARHLRAGDFIDIAPHRRHRVDWTAPDQATVWLAVFYAA
ncbi:cupin domain-containing protein [uncultured Azonexus sp.]|uniref:cupin domain-containing protein n=1 Tax=uncultured Azonexus sp. TaxID=520307 RepID=UPI00262CE42D|nr:cupin domain-containing protein [uncultured Azonexus sp.]